LNKQQTLYYDHKKYIKPVNHVSFKDHNNSNSIVSEYRKDIIRPQTALGPTRTTVERDFYKRRPNSASRSLQQSSGNTLFFNETEKPKKLKQQQQQSTRPWHYTSATLYPWRDRALNKS
jgi:hypothetical protein